MPPVQHDNKITRYYEDGRFIHRFRQSWCNTYMDCPERARMEMLDEIERVENDAACVGTALHAAFEHSINYIGYDGIILSHDDVIATFIEEWETLNRELDIQFIKRKPAQAQLYGERCAESFGRFVLPYLDPFATEVPFGPVRIYEDEHRIIEITGSIDYIDALKGPIDWKTAGREYQRWEKKRWAIQPTFYNCGLRHLGVTGLVSPYSGEPYGGPFDDWNYCVFVDNNKPEPQWVHVERPSSWDVWLVDQLLPIAHQLEALETLRTPVWPKRDQHALCSPKWCPAWDRCKGAHVMLP